LRYIASLICPEMYSERRPGTFGLATALFNQSNNYPIATPASSSVCGVVVVGPGVAGSASADTYGVLIDGSVSFNPVTGSNSSITPPTLFPGPMFNSNSNIN
jgi:hypothetical protein